MNDLVTGDLLVVSGLQVRYGTVSAVRGVDLSVGDGEMVALVGPNGAGKTSTLAAIMGLVASSGAITFGGSSVARRSIESIVACGLSLVPEGRNIFSSLTVRENLMIGASSRRDKSAIASDLDAQLENFPALASRLGDAAGLLSGGQQQQLAIARAMMSRPRMLLLDEPSLGLSPQMVDAVLDAVVDLHRRGTSVLLVEQNAVRAMDIADRSYVMSTGQITRSGSGGELSGTALLTDYLGADR